MRSFQQNLGKFSARSVRIVAVSVDRPEVTRQHCQKLGFTYAFLSDPKAGVIRSYDLLHAGGGMGGADIARPGEFLIDSTGIIRWVNLTEDTRVRARPQQILKVLDTLGRMPNG